MILTLDIVRIVILDYWAQQCSCGNSSQWNQLHPSLICYWNAACFLCLEMLLINAALGIPSRLLRSWSKDVVYMTLEQAFWKKLSQHISGVIQNSTGERAIYSVCSLEPTNQMVGGMNSPHSLYGKSQILCVEDFSFTACQAGVWLELACLRRHFLHWWQI